MDGKRPNFRERMQKLGRVTGLNRGPLAYVAEIGIDLHRATKHAEAIKKNEAALDARPQMIDQAAAIAQQPADNDREIRRTVRTAQVLLTEAAKIHAQVGEPTKESLESAARTVRDSVAERIAAARERNAARNREIHREP